MVYAFGIMMMIGLAIVGLVIGHDQGVASQKAPATYAQNAVNHLYFPQQKVAFTNCLKEHESSHPLNPFDLPPSAVPFIKRKPRVARLVDLGGG